MTGKPTGIMQRLRDETRTHHERAESRPLERAMFTGQLPRHVFVDSLSQRLLIHDALETQLERLPTSQPRTAAVLHPRQFQSDHLRSDLAFFGADVGAVAPLPATSAMIGTINNLAVENSMALLGMHYVFEGSKNGASFLAPRLRQAYGLSGPEGTRYFDAHGEQQRPLWAAFKAAMDGVEFTPAECDGIVAAAKATFDHIAELDDELFCAETPVA